MSTELHPSPVSDAVLPSVQTDLHLAREGRGGLAEQFLHHQPHGSPAARPGVQQAGRLQRPGVGQRRHGVSAPLLPQPRGQGE